MSQPDPVRFGLISERDWQYLADAAGNGDLETYATYARDLCVHNIPLWNTLFLGYDVVPHFVPIWKDLQATKRAMVELPRSHSKSYQITFGEISHDLAYSTIPGSGFDDPRIMLIQETATVVEDSIQAIRNIFESGGPNKLVGPPAFPDFKAMANRWTVNRIWFGSGAVSKDPSLVGVGAKGAITGKHPKKIIADDVVSINNSKTAHLRSQIINWWSGTVRGMVDPGTTIRILYTPYYEGDLHEWLKGTKEYRVFRQPALNRFPTLDDFTEKFDPDSGQRIAIELTEKGRELAALWPCPLGAGNCIKSLAEWDEHVKQYGEHRSAEFLLLDKFLTDPVGFASQFMLTLAPTDAPVKRGMLRFYSFDKSKIGKMAEPYNESLVQAFPSPDELVACGHGWDHAISKKRHADKTVCARGYRTKTNDVFFIYQSGKWDAPTALRNMESIYNTDAIAQATPIGRPGFILSEGIAFQEALTQLLSESSRRILPILPPLKDQHDKMTALVETGLLAHLMRGKVYFDIDDAEAIAEWVNFDGQGRYHDDHVDAARICFSRLRDTVKKEARVIRKRVVGRNVSDVLY